MSLVCRVQIVLNDITGKKAAALRCALEPDNVDFPEGLSLSVENAGDRLVFMFESRQDMKHMISSIDEVLGHVQVALRVME